MTHWKSPWCWETLWTEEEGVREWDGWMASPMQWTWTWTNSRRWWGTGRPGVLQSMGSQESDTTGWLNNNNNMPHTTLEPLKTTSSEVDGHSLPPLSPPPWSRKLMLFLGSPGFTPCFPTLFWIQKLEWFSASVSQITSLFSSNPSSGFSIHSE